MKQSERIDLEHVRRVANLAHLSLEAGEAEELTQDLVRILDYVAKLEELTTDDVEPTAHGVPLSAHLRADVPQTALTRGRLLQEAPERLGDGFGVPKVVE